MAQPTSEPWSCGGTGTPARKNGAGRRPWGLRCTRPSAGRNCRTPPARLPGGPADGAEGRARPCGHRCGVARARPKESPTPTAVGKKSPVFGSRSRTSGGVLWCWGAGLRRCWESWDSGVSSSPRSRRSRARSGYGQGSWGELRGTLGACPRSSESTFWSQPGSEDPSALPEAGVWGRWAETQSPHWDGERPRVPRRLTLLAFLPPTGAIFEVSRWLLGTDADRRGECTPRVAWSCTTVAAGLFILCAGRGVGFPSLGAANAGLAWETRLPDFFLLRPAVSWELALQR